MEYLSVGLNLVEKTKAAVADTNREFDHVSHQHNTLKLEIQKLTDYETQLEDENYELVKRLGLFEEEVEYLKTTNNKLEISRKDYEDKFDEAQLKSIEKQKEVALLKKEKSDLYVKLQGLEKSVELLESLNDHQKQDLLKDRQLVEGLQNSNKQLFLYKEELAAKKAECERLAMELNSLDLELKNTSIDLTNEQQQNNFLRKELSELRDKLSELEQQKRGFLNDIGVSKLGISTLNFSKMFHHDTSNNTHMNERAFNQPSSRESIVQVTRKAEAIDESKLFKTSPEKQDRAKLTENSFFNTDREQNKKSTLLRETDNRSYFNKNTNRGVSSVLRAEASLKVRESRMTSLLFAIGGDPDAQFDPRQDFMGISNDSKATAELVRLGSDFEPQCCYSDTIFLFNKSFRKTRVIIVITKSTLSFFNLRKNKLLKLYQLKSLRSITISASNYTLTVFHFDTQADLLIESYRRLEMMSYLNHMFKVSDLPKFELTVRKRFIVKTEPNQQIPNKIEVSDPNLKINMSFLQDAIRNSKKSGHLSRVGKNWFGGLSCTECFCLLSNIGIVLFKKYGVVVSDAGEETLCVPAGPRRDGDADGRPRVQERERIPA